MQIARIEGGKLAEEHLYSDQVELLTQFGLLPEPATALKYDEAPGRAVCSPRDASNRPAN